MSNKRLLLAAAGVAALAAIALATWRFPNATPDATAHAGSPRSNTPVPAAALANGSRSVGNAASAARPADIPDDRPFAEQRADLERRAAAGDGAAARRLGITLAICNHYEPVSDETVQNAIVESVARGSSMHDNGREMAPDEMLATLRLGLEQMRRDCKGVSGLDEADGHLKAFEWIARGAALGDPDAKAVYGGLAFVSFDTRAAIADAESIRDRKQQAIAYLQSSLADGDALALRQMAGHYAAGDLFAANTETAYAYLYAYSLTARASEIVPELLQQSLGRLGEPLDEAARSRAEDEGRRLAACCAIAAGQTP